jgi:predicted nucleic acid-binding protein
VILLLDADAFLCLRKISLLGLLIEESQVSLVMTGYVATHELSSIEGEMAQMRAASSLKIKEVSVNSQEYKKYCEFKKCHDRGEAEAVAWAITNRSKELYFVSQDAGAQKLAKKEKISHGNVAGLGAELVERGIFTDLAIKKKFDPCYQNPNACGHGCPGEAYSWLFGQ